MLQQRWRVCGVTGTVQYLQDALSGTSLHVHESVVFTHMHVSVLLVHCGTTRACTHDLRNAMVQKTSKRRDKEGPTVLCTHLSLKSERLHLRWLRWVREV